MWPLNRDLKPHNVMIDGRGKVRVTDFGLAGSAVDFSSGGKDIAAGTPALQRQAPCEALTTS